MPIDLTQPTGLTFALLPEIVLTAWALVLMIVVAWRHENAADQRLAGYIALVGLVSAMAAELWFWNSGVRAEGLAGMVALDPFRYATSLVFLIGAVLAVLLSLGYLEREDIVLPEFYLLVVLATVGMMFMAAGTDLIVIFLGLELMSVAVYVLAGINRRSVFAAEAALKYFLLGAFASAFFLYGIALIYGATGSTNIAQIYQQITMLGLEDDTMLLAGTALLLIGFAFKIAAVPFHMWAPDVYDGAPTPVTAFMAAAVKAAGFAALIRVLLSGLGPLDVTWSGLLGTLAGVTMIVGNLIALSQRHLKRMLAYSSIGHAGYLLVALTSGTELGAAAYLFYILAYTLMTLGAFAVLGAVGRDGERDVLIDDMSGLARTRPWVAFAMTVFMLSLLGFPGTAGFIGKWYILSSAVDVGHLGLAVVLVGASVISAGYYLPVIMAMYMKPPIADDAHDETAIVGAGRFVVALTTVALLLFGVWPNRVMDAAAAGAEDLRPSTMLIAEQAD
jgi:NADH-quinone oxidoreductase subunit N